MNNRIYGENVDINAESVKDFYEKRAEKSKESDNPYAAVLLTDHSPELMDEQMKIEKENILPKLNLDAQSNVLDIGCGIGRWAEKAIPVCKTYRGIDFSQNMVETAEKRAAGLGKDNYKFERMSFQELVQTEPDAKYNRVIISGILVYICDDDIKMSFNGLRKFLDDKCIIFVWEPCGVGQRLTLKDLPSEALKDNYNAIYRTKEEYNSFFKAFTDNGFEISFTDYYSALGGTVSYTDTDKIYYILERNR